MIFEIQSPKLSNVEVKKKKKNGSQPKQAKGKLYANEISSSYIWPSDFDGP